MGEVGLGLGGATGALEFDVAGVEVLKKSLPDVRRNLVGKEIAEFGDLGV